MEPNDAESRPTSEPSPDVTTPDEETFPSSLEEPAIDDKIAAFKAGKRITASSNTRSTWTFQTVIIVGLMLIAAATVGAIVRDVVYLEMLGSKQKSVMQEMQNELRRFGR